MNSKHLSACAAVLVALVACASTAAAADVNSTKLRKSVKAQNVFEHQASLETIANANGNTRDTRTQGFEDSVDYVLSKLESYGYDPEVVQFNMPEWVENSTPDFTRTDVDPDKSYVPGTADDDDSPDVDFISVELSPSANLTDVPVVPTTDITFRARAAAPVAVRRRTIRPPSPKPWRWSSAAPARSCRSCRWRRTQARQG